MFNYEKKVGLMRPESQMNGFKDVIEDCGLTELSNTGDKFTWCNRRFDENLTLERLDRFFGNSAWHSIFPFAETSNIDYYGSDHCLIVLNFCFAKSVFIQKKDLSGLF